MTAATYEDGIWAAGWIAAADRSALMEQARYNARVAAIDVPNVTALSLITDLKSFTPSEQTETEIAKQTQELQDAGPEGVALLNDIDTFISGINAQRASTNSTIAPWTRNDVYALNALKGQFLGQGGGDEAGNTQFYSGLNKQLGGKKGKSVFNDVRQFKNKGMHFAVDGKANYGKIPKKPKGNVIIDPGSYERVEAVPEDDSPDKAAAESRSTQQASNVLMVDGAHSQTGNPLMVGGPQIGYFYPGFTYEIDMNAPGLQWRGATSIPFPGYLLIGRGEDFANTLTSASADIIDQYVETLCNNSGTKYEYKGKCQKMETVNAGSIGGQEVTYQRTVHGPVTGFATVKGERVAISSKRSSYGKDTLDQLFFRRLSNGQVNDPASFMDAARLTPQTFNSFYMDNQNIAMYTSGLLPNRNKNVDPGLLTNGNGKYEWKGYAADDQHPQGVNPSDGTIVNWNESGEEGFMAADDQFGATAPRTGRLAHARHGADRVGGKWDLAGLASAMNGAATQDVRAIDTVPLLDELLSGSKAPSATAQGMLDQMVAWRAQGGSRLDSNDDGLIDAPGAASMDVAWPKIADAFMKPVLKKQKTLDELSTLFSRYDLPPGGQYSGWHQYFDRDVGELLGEKVAQPFANSYCGGGNVKQCRKDIWAAIDKAGKSLTSSQGTSDPSQWHSDAVRERIKFAPGILPTTMRYTNRPSGIQQVISFNGARP